MKGKARDKYIASTVVALREAGKTQQEIAEATGTPQQTVSDILASKGRWADVHKKTWLDTYRNAEKKKLQVVSLELSKLALEALANKIPNAAASQLAVVYGILRDKERLDAGESSKNIDIHATIEADALTKILDKLLVNMKAET